MKLVLEANLETGQFSIDDCTGSNTFNAVEVFGMLELAKLQVAYGWMIEKQKMDSIKEEVEDEA